MTRVDEATARQNQASEPNASTWLSANAGSGKTRVLTDRVARLLLDKVSPQNILCLTYTKAAASEMQNRLFKRLGEWSMTPDDILCGALAALGVTDLDADRFSEARRLFANAIETPGGLRIQTIHSFCASLLRRFPLEAGVSPQFVEMDDRAAAMLRDDIVEEMASGESRDLIDGIAAYLTDADLGRLTFSILKYREALSRPVSLTDIAAWFDLPPDAGMDTVAAKAFDGSEVDLIARLLPISRAQSKTYSEFGDALAAIDFTAPTKADFRACCKLFLYASGEPRGQSKSTNFPQSGHTKARLAFEPVLPDLHAFMDRVAAARQIELALGAARKTLALYQFAARFLDIYETHKQQRGWLDFDDLILRTKALLGDESVAAWVLYRLDGGLDHILVDEAQDTSPTQWQVIEKLAQEFTSGHGARDDKLRTIFVVGDKKQSIYSFQGADPDEFDRMRNHFSDRLGAVDVHLRSLELEHSFRSSDAILRFVDQVLATRSGAIPDMKHRAFRAEMPGRVDLWAAVPKTDQPAKVNWYDPVDIVSGNHHDVILARKIARRIKEMIGTETIPAKNGTRKLITAGDVLVLVRRRSDLFQEIIRACKAINLPVAGADRLKLGAELAVKDLAALLSFLATPEDDLSLAAALRSPLFGWSEAELYDLAAGRSERYLWAALRGKANLYSETTEILRDLRASADFLRPYDLIERILTRHDGRLRLLERLGPEAADGIDALLNQALAFERTEVPSLTGFLVWMQTDDVEVKRQMDNAGDLIRVMTVHGAKGLESPIVILPDTAKRALRVRDEVIPLATGHPIWVPSADDRPELVKSALIRLKAKQEEEAQRLFYVAMTRAETWLIVAGAGDVGGSDESWYQIAADALSELGCEDFESPTGPGKRYCHSEWSAGLLSDDAVQPLPVVAMPEWLSARVTAPPRQTKALAPSDLGGAKAIWSMDNSPDEDATLRRGRLVHKLFEHLPGTRREGWSDLAVRILAVGQDAANADEALEILKEVEPILVAPEFAFLFQSTALAEVDISAALPELGGQRISGAIDRLIVDPTHVLAVDFKTNASIPETHEETPEGLLRQMGAYLAGLRQIYPDRKVEVAILWTKGPVLMRVPDNIVMSALYRTATS